MRRLHLCLMISLLTACSTSGNYNSKTLQFKTLITPERVKRFELTIIPRPIDPLTSRKNLEVGPSERQFKNLLESALAENNFCHNGYLPLGRYAGESNYRLRGECKDAATAEDVAKFPNTIERW